jgi:hypothetical protein
MEIIDSKIVELGNERYLVYLKNVNVKESNRGKGKTVRAFVRKIDIKTIKKRNLKNLINNYINQFYD